MFEFHLFTIIFVLKFETVIMSYTLSYFLHSGAVVYILIYLLTLSSNKIVYDFSFCLKRLLSFIS